MKEVHVTIVAAISGLAWFLFNLFAVPKLSTLWPALANWIFSPLDGSVIIVLGVLLVGGYLAWEEEEHQGKDVRAKLAEYAAPNLRLDFQPMPEAGFVFETVNEYGHRFAFIRVLPLVDSPVSECKGFLESVERLEDDKWVSIGYASRDQLHWSNVWERGIEEVELYVGNKSQFLDVGFFCSKDPLFHLSVYQLNLHVTPVFAQYPYSRFKLGVRVAGKADGKIVDASIQLIVQRMSAEGQFLINRL